LLELLIWEEGKERFRKYYDLKASIKKMSIIRRFYAKKQNPCPNYNKIQLNGFIKGVLQQRK